MLTGQRPFPGHDAGSTITAMLSAEPRPMREAHAAIPLAVERVVSTCLAKDPDDRWQSARELKRALQWVAADIAGPHIGGQSLPAASRRRQSVLRSGWAAAGLLSIMTTGAFLVAVTNTRRLTTPIRPIQLTIDPPAGTRFSPSASLLSVSPDGRQVAFLALGPDGISRVWIRPLESSEARELPGTDNALGPFWSLDSRSVGFFANDRLNIVGAEGGPIKMVCEASTNIPAGTWNRDGVMLFSTGAKGRPGIYRVSTTGGPVTPLRVAAEDDRDSIFSVPEFLPDGRHFLYRYGKTEPPTNNIFIGSLDSVDSSKDQRILSGTGNTVYVPPGYLVYRRGETMLAQPFDPTTFAFRGQPIAVAHDVGYNPFGGRTMFSVSGNTLAYRPRVPRQLVWFDRAGHRRGAITISGTVFDPALAPDGSRLAMTRLDPATGSDDIWVMDLHRGVSSRLTAASGTISGPIWSSDAHHLLFGSNRDGGQFKILKVDASGTGAASVVAGAGIPRDWSRDGNIIVYSDAAKLFALSLSEAAPEHVRELPFAAPAVSGPSAALSPDSGWIAYTSDESGQDQVYVRSFPDGLHKMQVSSSGGADPQWRGDGRELYYLASDGHLMAVSIVHRNTLDIGPPRPLFATQASGLTVGIVGQHQYAVTRDGQRFLVNEPLQHETPRPITVVVNWRAGLAR
jgi:Tol biopolymer transport system component